MSSNVEPITANITIDVSGQVTEVAAVRDVVNSVRTFAETYVEGLNTRLAPYGVRAIVTIRFSMESEDAN